MHILEMPYYLGMSAKRAYLLRRRRRLPCRVISVGNLTTGGTGKTPCTIALAREAQRRGLRPIILTRGYKGTARGPVFVSRGEGPLLSVREAGDEPFLMAVRLSGVPIVKGGDRYASGVYALEHLAHCGWDLPSTVFILDDGYQHWGLYRDKDILLIDAINPFGTGRLLPLGRLREPLSAIGRADCIVLTRITDEQDATGKAEELISRIGRYNQKAQLYRSRQTPVTCRTPSGEALSEGWLEGRKVYAFCGIANPDSFRHTVLSIAGEARGFRAYRDHYKYTKTDIDYLKKQYKDLTCDFLVTTEKDMVKLKELNLPEKILCIEIGFFIDKAFFDYIFNSVIQR